MNIDTPLTGDVYGNSSDGTLGNLDPADLDDNILNINSMVTGDVTGAESAISGGPHHGTRNIVNVNSGGTVIGDVSGASIGSNDNSKVTASGNFVNVMFGGRVTGDVIGGETGSPSSSERNEANSNIVTIDGTVSRVVVGGVANNNTTPLGGIARYNHVIINDRANVSGIIVGAQAQGGTNAGSETTASDNKVTINGGTLAVTDIYGGIVRSPQGFSRANDNTVTFEGTPVLNVPPSLYGGRLGAATGTGSDVFTGNTLNLKADVPLTVENVFNFENLNFYLPTTAISQPLLTVIDTADLTDGATRSSQVEVGITGASSPPQPGDTVVLISAGTLVTNGNLNPTSEGSGILGKTLEVKFRIVTDANPACGANQLCAIVDEVNLNNGQGPGQGPVTDEPLTQGALSGAAFLTGSGDFLAGQAFSALREQRRTRAKGWQVFAAMGGEDFRHKTGSHIDTEGFHLVTGLTGSHRASDRETTLGAFIETGEGRYDSKHGATRGRGDLRYEGAGLIVELAFNGGLTLEGSLRGGKAHNDARSRDPLTPDFRPKYKTNGGYVGAHVGIGQKFVVNPSLTLEPYAQFLWLRQEGEKITDSAHLPSGERLRLEAKFKAVESQRLRLGVKAEQAFSETLTGYAGAALEREFDGKARTKEARLFVNDEKKGHDLASGTSSLKGTSGVFELGLTMKPSANQPLTVDFGVQGHVGQREGVSGNVTVRYAF